MIILPIDQVLYEQLIGARLAYRSHLDHLISQYPEIFPPHIEQGYAFSGWLKPSKKVALRRRRIVLEKQGSEYALHPCFIMPYLLGNTESISKGLALRKYNIPYHAIAQSIGKNAMFWYRAELALSRNNLVGTTVKSVNKLSKHILVDEHHDKLLGQKIYVASTVASGCFLGAAISPSIRFEDLKQAYSTFKKEAQLVCPDYKPLTINIDGFKSTRKAMRSLFAEASLILCFLHGILNIQTKATKAYDDYLKLILDKAWTAYQADNKRSFVQQIRRLQEWATLHLPDGNLKKAVLKLCQKKRV